MIENFFRSLFFWMLLIPSVLHGQNFFSGRVVDANNGEAIPNVHLLNQEVGNVTVTDTAGYFKMEIKEYPVVISFSHVSYVTRNLMIDDFIEPYQEIRLVPATESLEEIVITGDKYQKFFPEESFYVRQMEMGDDIIWVVGYPGKNMLKPELRVLTISGNIIKKRALSRGGTLFKDAFGSVRLVSPDSIYKVDYKSDSILFSQPFPRAKMEEYFKSMVAVVGRVIVFEERFGMGNYARYYAYNLMDSTSWLIHESYDRDLFNSAGVAKQFRHGSIPDINFSQWGAHDRGSASFDPSDGFTRYAQDRLLTYKPIVSHLFLTDDQIAVFEDRGPLLWTYSSSVEPIDTLHIEVPEFVSGIDMLQDSKNGRLHITYEENGRRFVGRLDEKSGQIIQSARISEFIYVENVRVYGGRVYFTHRSKLGSQLMNLYSLSLH